MKKIAIITSQFPVLSETFVGNEMRAMFVHGHDVLPVAFKHSKESGQKLDMTLAEKMIFLEDQPKYVPLKFLLLIMKYIPSAATFVIKQRGLSFHSLLWNGIRLAFVVWKSKCDHIHANFAHATTAHAIVAARLLNKTISFVAHGSDVYVNPVDLDSKLNAADFVIAVCEDMQKKFSKKTDPNKVKLNYCGIDPLFFNFNNKLTSKNGKLLFVGRLSSTKGVDLLLRALSAIDKAICPNLDIVGVGVLEQELKELSNHLGIQNRVTFLGSKDLEWIKNNAPNYLALVAPFQPGSNGARDTGPVVVKEAMAMGLPVISTRFMGVKEMVTEQTGVLVEVGDISGLANSIVKLVQMSENERNKLGYAGRQHVLKRFTSAIQAEKLSSWIEQI